MNEARIVQFTIVTSICALGGAALSLRLGAPADGVGARVMATPSEGGRAVVQVQVMKAEGALAFGVSEAKVRLQIDGQKVAEAVTDADGIAYANFAIKGGPHQVQVLDDKGPVIADGSHAWEQAPSCAEPKEWPADRERPAARTIRLETEGAQPLAVEVALLGDAISPAFRTRGVVRISDKATGKPVVGATLKLEAEGAAVEPAALTTRSSGTASFLIEPSYHSVVLHVAANAEGHDTQFVSSLPLAPAAGNIELERVLPPRTVARGHVHYSTGHRNAYLEVYRSNALVHASTLALTQTEKGSTLPFIMPELDEGLYWFFLSTSPAGADASPLTLRAVPILIGLDMQPLAPAYAACAKALPADDGDALVRAPRPLVKKKVIADGLRSRGAVFRIRSAMAKRLALGSLGAAIVIDLVVVLLLGRRSRASLDVAIARSSRWGLAAGVGLAALLLMVIAGLIAAAD